MVEIRGTKDDNDDDVTWATFCRTLCRKKLIRSLIRHLCSQSILSSLERKDWKNCSFLLVIDWFEKIVKNNDPLIFYLTFFFFLFFFLKRLRGFLFSRIRGRGGHKNSRAVAELRRRSTGQVDRRVSRFFSMKLYKTLGSSGISVASTLYVML